MAHTDIANRYMNDNIEFEEYAQMRFSMDCSQHFSIQTEDGKLSVASLAKFEVASGLNEEGTLVAAPVAVLTLTDNTDGFEVQAKFYFQSIKTPFYEPLIEVTRNGEVIYEEDYNGAITRDSIFYALRKMAIYYMLNEITEEKLELIETNKENVRFKINHNGVFRLEQFITKSEEQIEVTISRCLYNGSDYCVNRFSVFDTATKTRKDNPIMCHTIADREDENIYNASKKAFEVFDAAMSQSCNT